CTKANRDRFFALCLRSDRLRQSSLWVFFFQAEDGIRDFHVTGVQTCALPISIETAATASFLAPWLVGSPKNTITQSPTNLSMVRSEERRVGKEWRSRGARDQKQKKACDHDRYTPKQGGSDADTGSTPHEQRKS